MSSTPTAEESFSSIKDSDDNWYNWKPCYNKNCFGDDTNESVEVHYHKVAIPLEAKPKAKKWKRIHSNWRTNPWFSPEQKRKLALEELKLKHLNK